MTRRFPDFRRRIRCWCRTALSLSPAGQATLLAALLSGSMPASASVDRLKSMSLEELADLEVSIVGKVPSRLSDTPAAVYVITAEDIRRSAATRLPELLRMVPGLNYARLDAAEWAISVRGLNTRFSNKLLVLIDGRSVYTPLFSGTYWEAQDRVLEDIERIEVVRGPGASAWGANAVNGVINIITKSSRDTQGSRASVFYGNEEQGAWARHGGRLGELGHFRVYAKVFDKESNLDLDGSANDDEWSSLRAGFRSDLRLVAGQQLVLQGDVYKEDPDDPDLDGVNLLGRWERNSSDGGLDTLQVYWDRVRLDTADLGQEELQTLDLEYRRHLVPRGTHDLVWGLGYRWTRSDINITGTNRISRPRRSTGLFSAFVQDTIGLVPERWYLTLGSKFEHNDFTGSEVQPSARLSWRATPTSTLWAAVSRAVRTPSRAEHDISIETGLGTVPVFPFGALPLVNRLGGNQSFDSEKLLAYELGLRAQPTASLSLDAALFWHDYDDLRSFETVPGAPTLELAPTPKLVVRTLLGNRIHGEIYGLELAADWRPMEGMRVQASYAYQDILLHLDGASNDTVNEAVEGQSPHHQLSVRLSANLNADTDLDIWAYYVDDLPDFGLDAYTTMDLRLAHRIGKGLEIALVGRHLLEDDHAEFGRDVLGTNPKRLERQAFVQLNWEL